MSSWRDKVEEAAALLGPGRRCVAFTGAGVSVESGIPPFRGPGGLWSQHDPSFIEIDHFLARPKESWKLIKEIFYDFIGAAKPNPAHYALADLERGGLLEAVITQNIDNLHQAAGSQVVHEFHGATRELLCLGCAARFRAFDTPWGAMPPLCPCCGGLLKPDFVFFGEAIPERAGTLSFAAAETADVMLVVGTSGEVMPACSLPRVAKEHGAKIIEVNFGPSAYTARVSDVFLDGPAGEILPVLAAAVLGQAEKR